MNEIVDEIVGVIVDDFIAPMYADVWNALGRPELATTDGTGLWSEMMAMIDELRTVQRS